MNRSIYILSLVSLVILALYMIINKFRFSKKFAYVMLSIYFLSFGVFFIVEIVQIYDKNVW